ncbi:unnamed protein product, partial [Didymodactylos carnosus]
TKEAYSEDETSMDIQKPTKEKQVLAAEIAIQTAVARGNETITDLSTDIAAAYVKTSTPKPSETASKNIRGIITPALRDLSTIRATPSIIETTPTRKQTLRGAATVPQTIIASEIDIPGTRKVFVASTPKAGETHSKIMIDGRQTSSSRLQNLSTIRASPSVKATSTKITNTPIPSGATARKQTVRGQAVAHPKTDYEDDVDEEQDELLGHNTEQIRVQKLKVFKTPKKQDEGEDLTSITLSPMLTRSTTKKLAALEIKSDKTDDVLSRKKLNFDESTLSTQSKHSSSRPKKQSVSEKHLSFGG